MSTIKQALDFSDYLKPESVGPAVDWLPITPHATDFLASPVRSLRANTAGTIEVVTPRTYNRTTPASSTIRTLNFLAGETRHGIFLAVRDGAGTTATGIEGGI